MSFLQSELRQLSLPRYPMNRADAVRMLLTHEYGVIPPVSCKAEARILSEDRQFCAGKATLRTVELTLALPGGSFSFPMYHTVPKGREQYPLFVLANFTAAVPDRYFPVEEICDRGYGVLSVGYNDISKDADDGFSEGLGKLLRQEAANAGVPPEQLPGKIAIWTWTLSRMLDWALTQPGISAEHTAVIGHSRLGKTALVAGMLDQRFACVISNASGCSGAAITRGKTGEHVCHITEKFPFWFCEAYRQYAHNEAAMPFEQDWLLSTIAPRLLCVSSAEDDLWAGPAHEFLGCVAATPVWEALGLPGLVTPDRYPLPGEALQEGSIGYHIRRGCHYLSREDWNRFMDFLDRKGWQ